MRTIHANLKTHYEGDVRTIARCWKIIRKDTTEYRFTDHDIDLTVAGELYKSIISGKTTAFESKDDMSADTMDIEVILDASQITEADIKAGLFDNASMWIFECNYTDDPISNYVTLAYGYIGETEIHDSHVKVEFRSLSKKLNSNIGRTYSYLCDAEFGDSRCSLDLDTLGYKESGTVSSVTDRAIFNCSTAGGASFEVGKVVWTGGNNNGLEMGIKTFTSNVMTLIQPMPNNVQAGDAYTAYYGCDKTKADCKSYSNIVNHRGFPDLPGIDEMLKYPDARSTGTETSGGK